MFGLRFRTEAKARAKNGAAPQSTTGLASPSSSQLIDPGGCQPNISPIATARSASVNGADTSSRRCMSTSSGLAGASSVAIRGSSAMPQMGQLPGASRTICGCIGQTHSVRLPPSCTGGEAAAPPPACSARRSRPPRAER